MVLLFITIKSCLSVIFYIIGTHLASATKQETIASAHMMPLLSLPKLSSLSCCSGGKCSGFGSNVREPVSQNGILYPARWISCHWLRHWLCHPAYSYCKWADPVGANWRKTSYERLHMTRRSLFSVRRTFIFVAGVTVISITLALYAGQTLIFNFFLMFCITITSVAYIKLFRIIWRHQQEIQANGSSQNFGQPLIDFTKYKKSVFTILCILFVFYVGYLPMAISLLSNLVLNDREVKRQISSVSMMLLFWSSSLNPLLYLWRMKDIRDEVKQLFRRLLCKNN